jgi:hypothetical protein
VVSPLDYQVFQRNDHNEGTILVDATANAAQVEVRIKSDEPWQSIPAGIDGHYRTELKAPAGGWYRLELRAPNQDETFSESDVAHVGVGEVFVVGGQSNSTCWGEKRQKTSTNLVSSFDGKSWALAADPLPGVDGKGGSIWPIFGDELVAKFNVPIGIVPVGAGATSVRQWLPKGTRFDIQAPTTRGVKQVSDHEWECDGKLFGRMIARMKSLGPNGFRAMLWHQGESDANQSNGRTLPGDQYRRDMEKIITESRTEAGWPVPWFVAIASYHTPADTHSPDIRAAQKSLSDSGLALLGPDTDTLTGDNRAKNGKGVHMSDKGLHAHATMWVECVAKWMGK